MYKVKNPVLRGLAGIGIVLLGLVILATIIAKGWFGPVFLTLFSTGVLYYTIVAGVFVGNYLFGEKRKG